MSTVLSTRPAGEADPLVERLAALGYRVLAVPAVALEPAPSGGELDAAMVRLATYDWAIVTSATGARSVAAAARRVGSAMGSTRWAAVGPATAAALVETGVPVALRPTVARGAAIADALAVAGPIEGARILLARADAADAELPSRLREAGAAVDDVVAYRTVVAPPGSRDPIRQALRDPDLAAAVVASGSAIRGLVRLVEGDAEAEERLRTLPLVSIGPSTSAAVRAAGLAVAAEAAEPSLDAVARAVESIAPIATAESLP